MPKMIRTPPQQEETPQVSRELVRPEREAALYHPIDALSACQENLAEAGSEFSHDIQAAERSIQVQNNIENLNLDPVSLSQRFRQALRSLKE
jgi:hypothetical protein